MVIREEMRDHQTENIVKGGRGAGRFCLSLKRMLEYNTGRLYGVRRTQKAVEPIPIKTGPARREPSS